MVIHPTVLAVGELFYATASWYSPSVGVRVTVVCQRWIQQQTDRKYCTTRPQVKQYNIVGSIVSTPWTIYHHI